ncbi:uncharacterized protein FMAN_07172 [Fusarium mangiferae]|uniref:Uncharacterized protein n=1 Tax=Fusarium mangiferae TaxID=192010 RepID=A0A1L7T2W4_FUSMA|nr:uncharacterized protein FMAN_07172 [Fusarium mangiferae]CVK92239.1 uncharacterized protein FMAN_07172 [Fusarium mangiferae]
MSISKQDMKYLANGKVITEEALITIAAAKRDDFEKWCGTRQFQHFLMRARLGSPSDPMTLPRLQNWAADEMFHLRLRGEPDTYWWEPWLRDNFQGSHKQEKHGRC